MFKSILNKIKGWWKNMFDYKKIINDFSLDTETSKDMLDAITNWSQIYNGDEPWAKDKKEVISLHVAKTMCEKVAKAVTIELKTECTEKTINNIYQKFLRKIRKNTEYAIGKSCIFFKPIYENNKIKITVIQADKFIPIKFDDSGELLGAIFIDQLTVGNTVYTRLEYNELVGNVLTIKNIAYEGKKNGTVLSHKIDLKTVDKWSKIDEITQIEGVDKIIGGFFTMNNTNNIDNNSPLGVALFHNSIETLEQIDKQFSRILWEYEGSELAIDMDASMLEIDEKGNTKYPKGKKRLFRKFVFDDNDKGKWNIFSPEIRNNPLFDGLNEFLRQVESQSGLAFGVLSKNAEIAKTATEIKASKQDYYVTVSDIQTSLQSALEDLIYGIYVLCKLYGVSVSPTYDVSFDWDDSILVDKEALQNQSLIERNADIIDDVEYIMTTRDYSEEEAIEYIEKIRSRKEKYNSKEEELKEE